MSVRCSFVCILYLEARRVQQRAHAACMRKMCYVGNSASNSSHIWVVDVEPEGGHINRQLDWGNARKTEYIRTRTHIAHAAIELGF